MDESADGVDVTFARRSPQRFDLVIGADGVHSAVRRMAFGPETDYVDNLGYYYAVASGSIELGGLETRRPDGRAVAYGYNIPGRLALAGGQKAPNLFVFRAPAADYDRKDIASQRAFLASAFEGVGWRVPEMLAAANEADDFFLDALCRTKMTTFTRGRVALIGDAGTSNTLGGFGTGLALLGAYLLAGELVSADGDYRTAFATYDERMRQHSRIARKGNAGPFMAPPSSWRIGMRNATFRNRLMRAMMMRMTDSFANSEELPDYEMR